MPSLMLSLLLLATAGVAVRATDGAVHDPNDPAKAGHPKDYRLPEHAHEDGYETGDFKHDPEDAGVVRSEHAPWFDHNKTKYWYAERHPAHHGHEGDDEVADAEWRHSHADYDFAMQAGGGFHHHHVKDPRIAHVIASFHPVRMQRVTYGVEGEAGFQMYFTYAEKDADGALRTPHKISPWHDIPLVAGKTRKSATHGGHDVATGAAKTVPLFHFICAVPKGTTRRYALSKALKWNPIQQSGEYAYEPENGSPANFGSLVQTWDDPSATHTAGAGVGGHNDPLDVLQLNARTCKLGELQQVRVLGALAVVVDGAMHWKLLAVEAHDMETKHEWRVGDLPKEQLAAIKEWFRMYPTAEGRAENTFGLAGEFADAEAATKVVFAAHKSWKKLMHAHHDQSEL